MVNIAANMLGAKTEESSEAEGIFIYIIFYICIYKSMLESIIFNYFMRSWMISV